VENRKNAGGARGAFPAVALCAAGAEKALSNELKGMGIAVAEPGFGRVSFRADVGGLYLALMGLRTADRVLLEAGRFRAADFDALFDGALRVPWERFVPAGLGAGIDRVRSSRSKLRAETSIQSVTHKAVAQRLCRAHSLSRLPQTDDSARIRVHIDRDEVSLLLDLSGEPLFRRGYRKKGGTAPLRETTAAAMLLLSGWKRKYPLHDPFCGSGTILAEALMYAWDMAPNLGRGFAIGSLLIGDRGVEEKARRELCARIDLGRRVRISGSDADEGAARLAMETILAVKSLAESVGGGEVPRESVPQILTARAEDARPVFPAERNDARPSDDPLGFVVTNPPYGKRLGDREEARETYARMSGLAAGFGGWKLAAISDEPGFESFFGRKADSCRGITCGADPAFLFQYARL